MLAFPNVKINLGLNVVEKRPDGYHNLQSVFYPVKGLYDVLELTPENAVKAEISEKHIAPIHLHYTTIGKLQLGITGIHIPGSVENNLLAKAYDLVNAKYNLPEVKAHLHKIVPTGAGLGGGSADGAFFIKLLNNFFKLNMPQEQMLDYAGQLGSDCSFFIPNSPAFVDSRGDVFAEIEFSLAGYHIAIIKPDIHVSTAAAFSGIVPKRPEKSPLEIIQLPIEQWKGLLVNDFEATVGSQHPSILHIKEQLYNQGALYCSMSGSGAAVYGIFKEEPQLPESANSYFVWKGKL